MDFLNAIDTGSEMILSLRNQLFCRKKPNDFGTTHPQQNETDSAPGRVSCPPLAHPFHYMTLALLAHDARVGGSDQSNTIFSLSTSHGLQKPRSTEEARFSSHSARSLRETLIRLTRSTAALFR